MSQVFKSGFRPSFPLKYLFITCLYFALSLFGILHHEMWLDEMHHFLLAKESNSLGELYYNARYDGHPLLWNILLMVITRFSNDPFLYAIGSYYYFNHHCHYFSQECTLL